MTCCKQNEGSIDRIIRLIGGLIILLLAIYIFGGNLQIAAYIIGILAIITGLTGYCGIYALIGINTLDDKE